MRPHARATAHREHSPHADAQRRERLVTVLAVAAVASVALLAALMHAARDGGPDAARLALAGTRAADAPPPGRARDRLPCPECGVVETVVPLGAPGGEPGSAWRLRIRMDDGSVRTVEQRGALATGSRVTVAGGSIRVLSNRPGQG